MKKNKLGNILICTGVLMLTAAMFLVSYNLWDERRAAAEAGAAMETLLLDISQAQQEVETPDYIIAPEMEMPREPIGEHEYIGILEIPALGTNLPVIGEWSNAALKTAPCRYAGSAYQDDLVIAAHNYRSHFGNIKTLHAGDTVYFTDLDGNLFSYEVVSMEVLQDTAVEEMTNGIYDLTLFTCTYGGQSRVTIRCERIWE